MRDRDAQDRAVIRPEDAHFLPVGEGNAEEAPSRLQGSRDDFDRREQMLVGETGLLVDDRVVHRGQREDVASTDRFASYKRRFIRVEPGREAMTEPRLIEEQDERSYCARH